MSYTSNSWRAAIAFKSPCFCDQLAYSEKKIRVLQGRLKMQEQIALIVQCSHCKNILIDLCGIYASHICLLLVSFHLFFV